VVVSAVVVSAVVVSAVEVILVWSMRMWRRAPMTMAFGEIVSEFHVGVIIMMVDRKGFDSPIGVVVKMMAVGSVDLRTQVNEDAEMYCLFHCWYL
jgi:hypothetical protein